MDCEQCREAMSARLDGEESPGEGAALDAHLAGCAACHRWQDRAAAVTRMARISPAVAPPGVDLDRILAVAPGRGRARLGIGLRCALGVFGVLQFFLGVAQTSGLGGAGHDHGRSPGLTTHVLHESAAWNIAIGAGFVFIALRRARPAGLLPTLTAFIGVLTLLSAGDLLAGRVDPGRLVSHGLMAAGYVVVVLLNRLGADRTPPASGEGRPGWRATFPEDGGDLATVTVLRPRGQRPATARYEDRKVA
ncbi:zf-HC2 domain-containing protein [Longispora sp. K20-0274]|uniref:zf-HC2 domain-containing protein n=1 Tax=Longispora sp. K20-0274 TaxID=3088255 RepID=UPI00399BDC36